MTLLQIVLIDIGRVGMGAVFLSSIFCDLRTRHHIFNLMRQKNIPLPWLFFIGATLLKAITSLALIFNLYTFAAALVLASYIFIGNLVFNDFWSAPKAERDLPISLFMIHLASCFGLLVIAVV